MFRITKGDEIAGVQEHADAGTANLVHQRAHFQRAEQKLVPDVLDQHRNAQPLGVPRQLDESLAGAIVGQIVAYRLDRGIPRQAHVAGNQQHRGNLHGRGNLHRAADRLQAVAADVRIIGGQQIRERLDLQAAEGDAGPTGGRGNRPQSLLFGLERKEALGVEIGLNPLEPERGCRGKAALELAEIGEEPGAAQKVRIVGERPDDNALFHFRSTSRNVSPRMARTSSASSS